MVVDIALFLVGFLVAFVIGTFVEYAIHVLMHWRILLGKGHTLHHVEGTGQGWLLEFLVYFLPALPLLIALFFLFWSLLGELWLGIGFVAGGTWYAAFAAYAHQLQHERPELVFWMRQPVHTVHHVHNMWWHNFGISFDWWDRIFGTYKYVEWKPAQPIHLRNFVRIHWRSMAGFAPDSIPLEPLKPLPPEAPQITQQVQ